MLETKRADPDGPRRPRFTSLRLSDLLLIVAGLAAFAALLGVELEGGAAAATGREHSFLDNLWVAPADREPEAFSFAVFGDIQDGVAYFPAVYRSAIEDHGCELGVLAGDVVNEPTEANYRHLHRALAVEPTCMPLLAVLGNHDVKDGGANFRRSIGPKRFSVIHRDCLFVGLDGSGREDRKEEVAYLERELERAGDRVRHRFVFLHRPIDQEEADADGRAVLRARGRALFEVARRHGVDAIFAGHRHVATRRTVDGRAPALLTNGEGCDLDGGELWPDSVPWTLVEVSEDGVRMELIREAPEHAPVRIARFLAVGAAHPFLERYPVAAVALVVLAAALAGLGLHRARARWPISGAFTSPAATGSRERSGGGSRQRRPRRIPDATGSATART